MRPRPGSIPACLVVPAGTGRVVLVPTEHGSPLHAQVARIVLAAVRPDAVLVEAAEDGPAAARRLICQATERNGGRFPAVGAALVRALPPGAAQLWHLVAGDSITECIRWCGDEIPVHGIDLVALRWHEGEAPRPLRPYEYPDLAEPGSLEGLERYARILLDRAGPPEDSRSAARERHMWSRIRTLASERDGSLCVAVVGAAHFARLHAALTSDRPPDSGSLPPYPEGLVLGGERAPAWIPCALAPSLAAAQFIPILMTAYESARCRTAHSDGPVELTLAPILDAALCEAGCAAAARDDTHVQEQVGPRALVTYLDALRRWRVFSGRGLPSLGEFVAWAGSTGGARLELEVAARLTGVRYPTGEELGLPELHPAPPSRTPRTGIWVRLQGRPGDLLLEGVDAVGVRRPVGLAADDPRNRASGHLRCWEGDKVLSTLAALHAWGLARQPSREEDTGALPWQSPGRGIDLRDSLRRKLRRERFPVRCYREPLPGHEEEEPPPFPWPVVWILAEHVDPRCRTQSFFAPVDGGGRYYHGICGEWRTEYTHPAVTRSVMDIRVDFAPLSWDGCVVDRLFGFVHRAGAVMPIGGPGIERVVPYLADRSVHPAVSWVRCAVEHSGWGHATVVVRSDSPLIPALRQAAREAGGRITVVPLEAMPRMLISRVGVMHLGSVVYEDTRLWKGGVTPSIVPAVIGEAEDAHAGISLAPFEEPRDWMIGPRRRPPAGAPGRDASLCDWLEKL